MRTMIPRLQRLENRASMQGNEQGETPAEVLQRRVRIQCEADGVPFEDPPPEEFSGGQRRQLSVADILRMPWRSGPQVS
jgi:energy-coupling factor transporter ATP-binding protein EcfA2